MAIQWPLLVFGLLAGCGGGMLVFIGLSEILGVAKGVRSTAAIIALILLIVGGCASVLHLGQPANIMAAAANIFSFSGISVELIFLGVNVLIALVYLIMRRRGSSEGSTKVVAIIGLITGVGMAFVVGNGYVMESQKNWDTIALPLSYLASGLAMGGTFFVALMVGGKVDAVEVKKINVWVLGALVLQAAMFLIYAAMTGFVLDTLVFWGCAIVIGTVAALACSLMVSQNANLAYGALACAVVGGIALRAAMWLAGSGFLAFFALAAVRGVL
jgi:DMSO reductase anchor subunit